MFGVCFHHRHSWLHHSQSKLPFLPCTNRKWTVFCQFSRLWWNQLWQSDRLVESVGAVREYHKDCQNDFFLFQGSLSYKNKNYKGKDMVQRFYLLCLRKNFTIKGSVLRGFHCDSKYHDICERNDYLRWAFRTLLKITRLSQEIC